MMVGQRIEPVSSLKGEVKVPGDKSVSHRGLILGAMAAGRTRLAGLATGDDVQTTIQCLQDLGVEVEAGDDLTVVRSSGWESAARRSILDCRNSGTTMRLLAGGLAPMAGTWRLVGDESLTGRPMDRIATPLQMMGAQVSLRGGRYPPVDLEGGPLSGITYDLPVASAQVKGSILLAAVGANGPTRINEDFVTRDHTEKLLEWLGLDLQIAPGQIEIKGPATVPSFDLVVPGDLSSAAFLIAAAVLTRQSDVTIAGVGINPTRTGFLDILQRMGADVTVAETSADPEPIGTITARSSSLRATDVEAEIVPRAIDELPLVAVAAAFAEGQTTIAGAAELRYKESDRISSVAASLRALGVRVTETQDGLIIDGGASLRGGIVDAKGDHRMGLAMAVAGLASAEPITITGWEATNVSFPGFIELLDTLKE